MSIDEDNLDVQQEELIKKYDSQIEQLENQIEIIKIRQQELQNYIVSLDQAIRQIDGVIFNEEQKSKPDYNKIKNLRFISSRNFELITNIYNTYQKFEDVKFKYYKEIDNHSHAANRLIYIEMVKLLKQSDSISDTFGEMIKYLASLNNVKGDNNLKEENIISGGESLADDPEYTL